MVSYDGLSEFVYVAVARPLGACAHAPQIWFLGGLVAMLAPVVAGCGVEHNILRIKSPHPRGLIRLQSARWLPVSPRKALITLVDGRQHDGALRAQSTKQPLEALRKRVFRVAADVNPIARSALQPSSLISELAPILPFCERAQGGPMPSVALVS